MVDPGTARISRYSHRTKVQRLPIERISQASANQRKGRCGRVAEGICIRLYSEEDFLSRPEFTEPEILRTNLASVILQMAALGLGDVEEFPFVDGPDRRQVKDGVALLTELGALQPAKDGRHRLTALGRTLAQLPIDPRLGRMVVEEDRNGCLHEVMVIAAALSIQDPRERPVEQQQAAAQKHARFAVPDSDFLAYLNLWNYLNERQQELSGNQFRKMCREEFLNYLRVREWQDIYAQLRQIVQSLGMKVNTAPADAKRIHLSLLAVLLSHIGLKDPEKHEYLGARGARFAIFPGSALFKKQPRWVMSAELVESSSGTPSSKGNGIPATRSSAATRSCCRRSKNSSTGCAAVTSSSTTTSSSTSTTSGSALKWSPSGTSTAGGSGCANSSRACSTSTSRCSSLRTPAKASKRPTRTSGSKASTASGSPTSSNRGTRPTG